MEIHLKVPNIAKLLTLLTVESYKLNFDIEINRLGDII